MDNPERVIAAINALLSPFPAGVTQGPAEEVFRRYLEAVDEFTADDIDGGVDLLMKGKLPGYNGNFAPTPPQLASAARIVRDKRLDSEALTRRYTPRLPAPDIAKTPEQRARARAKMEEFVRSVGGAEAEQTAEALAASKARWERVNARFDPPQDEASLTERLNLNRDSQGYIIGSPESDEAAA